MKVNSDVESVVPKVFKFKTMFITCLWINLNCPLFPYRACMRDYACAECSECDRKRVLRLKDGGRCSLRQ